MARGAGTWHSPIAWPDLACTSPRPSHVPADLPHGKPEWKGNEATLTNQQCDARADMCAAVEIGQRLSCDEVALSKPKHQNEEGGQVKQ